MKKSDIIGAFIVIAIFVPVLMLAWSFAGNALDRQERSECLKWQEEAKIYPNYYLTEWQKEQCDHHGLTVDVPVQNRDLLDRFTSTPSPTPTPSASPKIQVISNTIPMSFPTISITPTASPTPTAQATVVPTPMTTITPDPTPTQTPEQPVGQSDKKAPNITKLFYVTNNENGVKDTLYYFDKFCTMCILIVSDEPISGNILFVASKTPKKASELSEMTPTSSPLSLKAQGSGKIGTQQVEDVYIYLADLPEASDSLIYFKVDAQDEAGNKYSGPWSQFNADHKVYIW